MSHWRETLEKKQRIKQAMEQLKYETAEELGIAIDDAPTDVSPIEVGTFAGPVGGRMVSKLIQLAQQQLVQNYNVGDDDEG